MISSPAMFEYKLLTLLLFIKSACSSEDIKQDILGGIEKTRIGIESLVSKPIELNFKVNIKQGQLVGTQKITRNGRKIQSFLGIPFAKPPVGALRFKSPQTHQGWKGVLKATTEAPRCTQILTLIPPLKNVQIGVEDCLYINVHTPQVNTKKKFPVMVYIYGGAFQLGDGGSATYGPDFLLDRDVILVTFNYRLGILGFLSFQNKEIPGNIGLKDQNLALQWVKYNIEAFGGDSNSITIFGESSGAASVHYQLLSPKSKGLFHKAIMQSTSAFCAGHYIPRNVAKQRAEHVAKLLGCSGNAAAVLKCLQEKPQDDIIKAQKKFFVWSIDPIVSFAPTAEIEHDDAFITKHPVQYTSNPDIPILIGFNKNEGALRAADLCTDNFSKFKVLNKNWDYLLPYDLMIRDYIKSSELAASTAKSLKKFYLNGKDVDKANIERFSDMWSDVVFKLGVWKAARHHTGKVYYYLYDYQGKFSFQTILGSCPINLGVCHLDDTINLFNLDFLSLTLSRPRTPKDLATSYLVVQLWTSFAGKGVPCDDSNKIKWQPFNKISGTDYLYIGQNATFMKSESPIKTVAFLNSLPVKLGEKDSYE